ncbi:MAG: alpha/beta fold hydrolase [Acidimicrobiia bacterium]
MRLHAEVEGSGPRLVLVHGFTQTGRCWGPLADRLARDHEVVRVDAPGHGRSAEIAADLWETADLLARVGGPATWLGYSMGARMVLHLALAHPEVARGLVLIGATAGIEDPAERAARRAADRARARELAEVGLDAFLDRWLAQPLFATLPTERAGTEERRTNTVEGLAASLVHAGTGTQEPLWSRLGEIGVPVLALAGARDERYAALATRLATAVGPGARAALVPDAGHAAHLEAPDEVAAQVGRWLAEHGL